MPLTTERRYKRLLDPVDRGELSLPEQVLAARAAVHRLTAALGKLPVLEPEHVVRSEVVRAALESDDPTGVDVSNVFDHERQVAEATERRQILTRALEIADGQLAGALEDHAEAIIVHHVRPAGERLWPEITKAVRALDAVEVVTPDALLRAPDRARRGYLALDGLATQYGRLRQAWNPLPAGQPVEHDVQSDHAEFEAGLCVIIGPNWRGQPMAPNRPKLPWPDDPRGRLIWLVRAGHIPWWPTAAERDIAWMAAHREQHDRMQRQQLHHRVAQEWGRSA